MVREKNIILSDLSHNFTDPSNYNFSLNKNPKLVPLQLCRNNNNLNIEDKKKQEKNNINSNKFIFNMGLDKILNDIKVCREENYKNISYNNIINYLDKNVLLLTNKSDKENWDNWLHNINDKYNNICIGNLTTSVKNSSSTRSDLLNYPYAQRRKTVYRIGYGLPPPPLPPKMKKVNIDVTINSLRDLLQLCKDYPLKIDIEYNINMKAIHNIKEPLDELDKMIGLSPLKLSIMDQILYFIQNLHKTDEMKNNDFMHTVIYGPPGTGKTEVAKIMGKIFSKMGVLSRNVFKKATRADLIAGYLGQTALKTKDLIKDCLGGVLFIDEAYALGNNEKRDSFAKECIDTLCEALSDHKDNLMVIIAGYEDELKTCFFDYNQGLDSRFTWRFKTTDYNSNELKLIFEKKVKDIKWNFKEDIPSLWFENKKKYFKFFGRDMETLFAKTKIAHSRRIFCKDKKDRKLLTMVDLDKGFEMYCDNNEVKNRDTDNQTIAHLYL